MSYSGQIREPVAEAIARYLEDRYKDCIELLVSESDLPFVGNQLLLISLVRTGQTAVALEELQRSLPIYPPDGLEASLLMLSVGVLDLDPSNLETMVQSQVDACRLHYYYGESKRTLQDDTELMCGAFLAAALTETDTPEQKLAEQMCGRFGVSTLLNEHRIARLFERGEQLLQEGKWFETIGVWAKAVRLAEMDGDFDRVGLAVLRGRLGLRLEEACEYEQALAYLEPSFQVFRECYDRDRPELAIAASAIGRCHLKLQQYDAALARFEDAVSYWAALKGETAPDTITAIDEIAFTHEMMGNLEKAQSVLTSVIALREQVLGTDDEATIASRNALAALIERARGNTRAKANWDRELDTNVGRFRGYLSRGDREGAKHMIEKTKETVSTIPVEQVLEGVEALHLLVRECMKQGEVQMEVLCSSACSETADLLLGACDSRSLTLRSNLAEAQRRAGNFQEALRINEECLVMRRESLGSNHPDVALSLNNLAQVHQALEHADYALSLMSEALRIDREALGERHDAVAGDLLNIGVSLGSKGDYVGARKYYWSAIDIWKELHPEGHHHLGVALLNLGAVYRKLGDPVAASLCFQQSLAMLRATAGESHPDTLAAIAVLARLEPDERTQAEFSTKLALAEERLGKDHPFLTVLRTGAKGGGEAVDLDRALMLLKTELGAGHADTLVVAEQRVNLLAKGKDFTAAKSGLEELIADTALNPGRGPTQQAWLYWKLAAVEAGSDELTASLTHTRTAIQWFDQAWNQLGPVGVEQDVGELMQLGKRLIDLVFSLLTDRLSESHDIALLALQFALRYKHLATTLLEREREAARNDTRPEVQEKFALLRRLREQVANELTVGPGSRGALFAKTEIHQWQLEYRRRSEELAQMLALPLGNADVTGDLYAAICQAIPCDGVVIEYIRFDHIDFRHSPIESWNFASTILDPPRYVAFSLHPGATGQPVWTLVGSEDELTVMAGDLSRLLDPESAGRDPGARSFKDLPVPASWQEAADTLCSAIFDPLPGVGNFQRLFIATDGVLANVPFELFPDPLGGRMIEKRRISYVDTARDLIRFGEAAVTDVSQAVVITEPEYDCLDLERSISRETLRAFHLALASSGAEQYLRHYPKLKDSFREGEATAKLLRARLLTGKDANREQVLALRSPRILHIASHGYYPDSPATDAVSRFLTDVTDFAQPPQFFRDSTSSLKSGLALAGANWKALLAKKLIAIGHQLEEKRGLEEKTPEDEQDSCEVDQMQERITSSLSPEMRQRVAEIRWIRRFTDKAIEHVISEGAAAIPSLHLPPESCGNGFLTAEDVAWLDLTGTELVVLSTCGSGLGLYEFADGLFGLKRSFFIAGARRLVCSLWPVPDRQTADLMQEFYAQLEVGEAVDEALRKAKLKLQIAYPDQPYYWAAFILQGDPSPFALAPEVIAVRTT
jgi:tetratricopeptide (TPR) repeat protein